LESAEGFVSSLDLLGEFGGGGGWGGGGVWVVGGGGDSENAAISIDQSGL